MMMRTAKMKKVMRLTGGVFALGVILAAAPLLTQSGGFNSNSVMPTDCSNGKMKCGFIPLKASEWAAVKEDPSNLIRHRGLPSRKDLSSMMPPIGNQGRQGSCVGWASAYGMKSYHEKMERRWGFGRHAQFGGPGSHVFSPAYIYNQINRGRDRGSNPATALRLMRREGVSPWRNMPYTDKNYRRKPGAAARREAGKYKIKSYSRLNFRNPNGIKNQLAKGRVVLIGIKIYSNFYKLGRGIYERGRGAFRGGHAILLVGYDDTIRSPSGARGAFKIFNSWGTRWGNNGYGWISYKGLASLGLGAFAVYDEKGQTAATGKNGPQIPSTPPGSAMNKNKIAAPARVVASRGTYSNRVAISWAKVSGASAYSVERAGPTSQDFASIGFSRVPNFLDNKVQKGAAYRYRVVTMSSKARSNPNASPVAEGFAAKRKSAPPQIAGLNANVSRSGRVNLRWNRAAGAAYYQVIRFDRNRRKWIWLRRKNRSSTFVDRRPIRGKKNYYRVRAINSSGKGRWSANVSAQISGAGGKPGKVKGLVVSKGLYSKKVRLSWKRTYGAVYYGVYRFDPRSRRITGVFKVRGTRFADKSKQARSGRKFGYLVAAFNKARKRGAWSKYERGYTSPGKRRGSILAAPENLKAKINARKRTIQISWKPVKNADSYYIFRKKAGDKKYVHVSTTKKNRIEAKIPGVPGDLYFFVVRTKSFFGGESANSNAVSAFVNRKRYVVRHRFLDDGFNKFKGKWSAVEWDGETAPKKIELTLEKDGDKFKGILKTASGQKKTFEGTFASKSQIIEGSGFRMQIARGVKGVSTVEIADKDDEGIRMAFTRE